MLAVTVGGCTEERPEPPTPEEDAAARARLMGSEWLLAAIEPAGGDGLEPTQDAREMPRVAFAADPPAEADAAPPDADRPGTDRDPGAGSSAAEGRPTTEREGRPTPGPEDPPADEPRAAMRDPDLRRLEGHGGCNSFSGTYRLAPEGELAVRGLFATEVACMPPEVMEVESAFLSHLSDAEMYRFEGDDLVISGPLGALRLAPLR